MLNPNPASQPKVPESPAVAVQSDVSVATFGNTEEKKESNNQDKPVQDEGEDDEAHEAVEADKSYVAHQQ